VQRSYSSAVQINLYKKLIMALSRKNEPILSALLQMWPSLQIPRKNISTRSHAGPLEIGNVIFDETKSLSVFSSRRSSNVLYHVEGGKLVSAILSFTLVKSRDILEFTTEVEEVLKVDVFTAVKDGRSRVALKYSLLACLNFVHPNGNSFDKELHDNEVTKANL
jgi:hypothetical protein